MRRTSSLRAATLEAHSLRRRVFFPSKQQDQGVPYTYTCVDGQVPISASDLFQMAISLAQCSIPYTCAPHSNHAGSLHPWSVDIEAFQVSSRPQMLPRGLTPENSAQYRPRLIMLSQTHLFQYFYAETPTSQTTYTHSLSPFRIGDEDSLAFPMQWPCLALSVRSYMTANITAMRCGDLQSFALPSE